MSNMKELIDKQVKLTEELEAEKVKVKRLNQELDRVSIQLSELKEQQDYGSFRFLHQKIPDILKKITPKHKIPPPRDLIISSGSDSPKITASIPWTEGDCSDENPININVCPRCTILHLHKVLGGLLAEYYSK